MDWMRNLRVTLRYENKVYVLDEQIPTINDDLTQEEIEAHQKHYDDANKVSCIMASSMSLKLQKTFENTWAYEINQQLKEIFQAKASKECLDVVKSLMVCQPKPGASIFAFVLVMKGLLQTNEQGIKKIDMPSTSTAPVLTVRHNAKKGKISHFNWKGKAAKGKSDRGSNRKVEYDIAPTSDPKEAVVTPVKPDDISLPIRKTSGRVSKPPRLYYSFHIEGDKISDSTLSELDEPANYKEAMASPKAAK
nr:hypothetical protein [Tanacetum cinerariifolium]